jgi:hypothetical protein
MFAHIAESDLILAGRDGLIFRLNQTVSQSVRQRNSRKLPSPATECVERGIHP